jgi:hypothetical protein
MADKPDGTRGRLFAPQMPGLRETIILVVMGLIALLYFLWPYLPSAVE